MPLYRMTLGYDGTDFFGSQVQTQGRTVQSELESAIRQITGTEIRLALAGRTDRGVHAVGQVASGNIPWRGETGKLRSALNAVGPKDIVVSRVDEAEEGFHARFSARWREYRYRLVINDTEPVLTRRYTWWRRAPIDPELASEACKRIMGTHSFGTFASAGWSQALTTAQLERTVFDCRWVATGAAESPEGQYCEMRITAGGFLPQMVRNITAAVVAVASGEAPVSWIDELLVAGDRGALPAGAPPHGLVLWRVGYTEFDYGSEA